jgi:hypothetical protein
MYVKVMQHVFFFCFFFIGNQISFTKSVGVPKHTGSIQKGCKAGKKKKKGEGGHPQKPNNAENTRTTKLADKETQVHKNLKPSHPKPTRTLNAITHGPCLSLTARTLLYHHS